MSTSPAQRVAAEVRAEMARQQRTQTAMARGIGRNQQWLSRRLTGQIAFDVADLIAIAEWLGVPLSSLLPATTEAVA